MMLKRRKKLASQKRFVRQIKKWAKYTKRTKKLDQELREKNSNLVIELQRERMKSSSLYNDLTFLQCENFKVLNHLIANRGNQSCLVDEVVKVESFIRELVGAMMQASNLLAGLQISCSKIKSQVSTSLEDQQVLEDKNGSGSPVSSRSSLSLKERRRLKANKNVMESSKDNLDVIEEVSHENSISPNLQQDGSRYERKCKKGLKHLFSTRTRKSFRKSVKASDSKGNSPPKATISTNLDESKLDMSDENSDRSKADVSGEASEDHSMSETSAEAKNLDAESSHEPTLSEQSSCINDGSSQLSGSSRKSLRYSDVVKSSSSNSVEKADESSKSCNSDVEKSVDDSNESGNSSVHQVADESRKSSDSSIEEKANRSSIKSSTPSHRGSVESNLELSNSDLPKDKVRDLSSLSSVTIRRGTNRHCNISETARTNQNNLSSSNSSPKKKSTLKLDSSNILASTDAEDNRSTIGSGSSITYRRHYRARDNFTFISDPDWSVSRKRRSMNDSTIKAIVEDKEEEASNETIVPKTKKKKSKKPKKSSRGNNDENCMNCTYQLLPDENSPCPVEKNSARKNGNSTSTPLDSVKQNKNKRHPLGAIANIASSTLISVNDSKLSKVSRNFSPRDTLSLSPIQDCQKVQRSLIADGTGNSFDNSNATNNESSGCQRPRRNAAKKVNYKEPPLSVKMRRT